MPRKAQQIIGEFQNLNDEQREEQIDHLYDISHALDGFAGEFAQHDEELSVETQQDVFHMFQCMKALSNIAGMASGENSVNGKRLDSDIQKLADIDLADLFSKKIDEKTADIIGKPEWAGKTYHEALADHLENDEYVDIEDFDKGLSFVNNQFDLGMNMGRLGLQGQPVQENAQAQYEGPVQNPFGSAPQQNYSGPQQNTFNTAPQQNPNQPQNPFEGGGWYNEDPQVQNSFNQSKVEPARFNTGSAVLDQILNLIAEAARNISSKTGMAGPEQELQRQLPNNTGNAFSADNVVTNVKQQVMHANLSPVQAGAIRGDLSNLDKASIGLQEGKALQNSGLLEGQKELNDLQTMFSTRTARLYGNSSEYNKAKTALDNYVEARNNLIRNYEESMDAALKSGWQLDVNQVNSKRADLEKKLREAENTLRTNMTTYVNKVSRNGTKSIDEMSHGYGAARLAGGNGVLGFLDKHGITTAVTRQSGIQRDSRVFKNDEAKVRETDYREMFMKERAKNEAGKDRRKKAADASLSETKRKAKEAEKSRRNSSMSM